jgi:hypothetical protein
MANVKVFSNPNTSIVFTDEQGKFVVNNVKKFFEAQRKDILLNLKQQPLANKTSSLVLS